MLCIYVKCRCFSSLSVVAIFNLFYEMSFIIEIKYHCKTGVQLKMGYVCVVNYTLGMYFDSVYHMPSSSIAHDWFKQR